MSFELRAAAFRKGAAVFVLFVLAGCDPKWKAEGFVEDSSGAPVEGATVSVVCPDVAKPLDQVKTTATGRFEVGGIGGSRALGCSLEVSKPGWHLHTAHMTDACFRSAKTHDYNEPCRAREGHIVLVHMLTK